MEHKDKKLIITRTGGFVGSYPIEKLVEGGVWLLHFSVKCGRTMWN